MKRYRTIIRELSLFKGKRLSIEELKGGLTNANFKIRVGKDIYVARFAPQNGTALGIDKASEFRNCAIAEELGIGPKPIKFFLEHNLLLVEYISGQVSNLKRIRSRDPIKQLALLLKKLHSGTRFKNSVNLFAQTRGFFITAQKLGARMPANMGYLMASIRKIEEQLKNKSWIKPSHLDLMIANVIHVKNGLKLIDWEYSGNADCRYDLAMISFKAKYTLMQDKVLLKYYGSPALSLHQLDIMKCIVALREAGWALVQIKLSNVKYDYKKQAAAHISRFNSMAKKLLL